MPRKTEGRLAARARELANSHLMWERVRATRLKSTPPDVLDALTRDEHPTVRQYAWSAPKIPAARLAVGVTYAIHDLQDGHTTTPEVLGVLRNPNLTSGQVLLMSAHPLALLHPNFLDEEIIAVAGDRSKDNIPRRKTIATRTGLPQEAQDLLATDPSTPVRRALAANTTISDSTVIAMVNDRSAPVLRDLLYHSASEPYREDIVGRLSQNNRGLATSIQIARFTTDVAQLRDMVASEDIYAWTALGNPNVTPDILLAACYHPRSWVRQRATAHPDCPEEGLIVAALAGN